MKLPNSGLPAYIAAQNDIMATAPIITKHDADPQVGFLILHETRRDAFVHDIALLEEQLPGRDRGADDADHEQHHIAQLRIGRPARNEEIARHLRNRRMNRHQYRHQQQAQQTECDREALEAPEVARADRRHRQLPRRCRPRYLGNAEEIEHERDADELGHDGQRVEDEQVDDAECAPELAEALEDQPGVADAGHGAQTQHHLLVDEENGTSSSMVHSKVVP